MKRTYLNILLILTLLVGGVVFSYVKEKNTAKIGERLNVITTLFPTYDFVRQVGGEKVAATLLLPPGVEPHDYEPTPRDIVRINNASVFIFTGKYMEPWVEDVLQGTDHKNTVVVDVSNNIKMLSGEEEDVGVVSSDNDQGGIDPHIWLNPNNAVVMVDNILLALQTVDPVNAEYFKNNADIYKQKLINLDGRFQTELKNCRQSGFVHGGHYTFGYLAHRYGLAYTAAQGFSPDAEPTPQQLISLTNQVRKLGIKYIYYEELVDPKIARTIAAETGAELLKIHGAHNMSKEELSDGETYERIMENNLNQLKKGLECQ